MFVIHALWRDGLTLWGEDSLAARTGSRAADHPFAASVEDLADVAAAGSKSDPLAGVTTLSLPTRARVPLDSPELVRDEVPQDGRGAVTLGVVAGADAHLRPGRGTDGPRRRRRLRTTWTTPCSARRPGT